jgi:hypothetical protein
MHDSVAIKIRAVIVMCLNHSQIYDLTHNEDFPNKTKKNLLIYVIQYLNNSTNTTRY